MTDDLGLLASRLAIGLGYAAHGAQKAFGWFEGPGLERAGGFMESLGLRPGAQYATLAAYGEVAAGTMMALGLGGPLGPALVVSGMLVAIETVHRKNGFFVEKQGVERPLLYAAGAVALASSGYGALSLDRALGLDRKLRHPLLTALALGGGIAAGYATLAQRDLSPPEGTLATPTIAGARTNGEVGAQPASSPG